MVKLCKSLRFMFHISSKTFKFNGIKTEHPLKADELSIEDTFSSMT